jgi:hypothetical protein
LSSTALLIHFLRKFKLPGLVAQVAPSYSSVAPVSGGLPPKAKAAVCVPQPT